MQDKARPCKKCGACDRYPSGGCRPCGKANYAKMGEAAKKTKREKNAAYYNANKDAVEKRRALYRAENAKALSEKSRAWFLANKERAAIAGNRWREARRSEAVDRMRKWRSANPDKVRAHANNRRARKEVRGGVLSSGIAERLFVLQKGKCPCCKQPLGDDYHLDHIIPFALGGANTDDNVQLLRAKCNQKKHAKHPIEFMQSMGFLL